MAAKKHGLTGRPSNASKPDDQKKTKIVSFRVSKADYADWESKSNQQDMKIKDWMIKKINE